MRYVVNFVKWFFRQYRDNPVMAYSLTAGFAYLLWSYKERFLNFFSKDKKWIQPVTGEITSKFGGRLAPILGASKDHKGVDVAVPVGTDINCPRDGKIISWDWSESGGTHIQIDHGDYVTGYMHLSSVAQIESVGALTIDNWQNAIVKQGEVFARTGTGGTGAHLHFELLKDGKYIDPLRIFNFKK